MSILRVFCVPLWTVCSVGFFRVAMAGPIGLLFASGVLGLVVLVCTRRGDRDRERKDRGDRRR